MSIEAMKQALEALITAEAGLADIGDADREPGDDLAWCEARAAQALSAPRSAITSLRQAIEQAEKQEPPPGTISTTITTTPMQREWVGLTEDELQKALGFGEFTTESTKATLTVLARAIETKLKQKNGYAEEKNT